MCACVWWWRWWVHAGAGKETGVHVRVGDHHAFLLSCFLAFLRFYYCPPTFMLSSIGCPWPPGKYATFRERDIVAAISFAASIFRSSMIPCPTSSIDLFSKS